MQAANNLRDIGPFGADAALAVLRGESGGSSSSAPHATDDTSLHSGYASSVAGAAPYTPVVKQLFLNTE